MQLTLHRRISRTHTPDQATRVILPCHENDLDQQPVNDDVYHEEESPIAWVLSILANVIGGSLLLSAMFILPQVIAGLFS